MHKVNALRVQTLMAVLASQTMIDDFLAQLRRSLRAKGFQCEEYVAMRKEMGELLAMLDASSFGGHKTYRCLTPLELHRLEEIRQLSK